MCSFYTDIVFAVESMERLLHPSLGLFTGNKLMFCFYLTDIIRDGLSELFILDYLSNLLGIIIMMPWAVLNQELL